MHGYELRKQLNALLGSFRALSYGTLYPALKGLLARGLIGEDPVDDPAQAGRRSRIVYRLTAEGKGRLQELLADAGPSAWDDEPFGVHFAFFGRTDAEVRLRILEGRRSRLEERLDGVRTSLARTRERLDSYTLALQQHGLESVEREVRWLTELIETERSRTGTGTDTGTDTGTGTAGDTPAPTGRTVTAERPGRTDRGGHPRRATTEARHIRSTDRGSGATPGRAGRH